MSLMRGTILKRSLDGFLGFFLSHMGVYIGSGLVIHFIGAYKKSRYAVLRIDTVRDFADGQTVSIHAVPRSWSHGEAICAEAFRLQALGAANGWNYVYDFIGRNCEDFSIHCYEAAYFEPLLGGKAW